MVMALSTLPSAQRGAGGPVGDALRSSWTGARLNIKESADLMPEADYAFKPTPEVRSFGAILAHLAGANYVFCSAARGEKSPHPEDEFEKSATTRAAIVKALGDSLTYCDAAFAPDDATLTEMVDQPFGGGKGPRAAALIGELGHMNEHYGNLVTYFRLKGIVPPSSRRR
jgi:DinB superfamily